MSPEEIEIAERLNVIFMPYAAERRAAMQASKGRFVHYTSAASGLNIIQTKAIWMRNATCMSDYREVQHGFDTLKRFLSNESNKNALFHALDSCSSGIGQEAITLFDQWWHDIQVQTYITSISEHADSEDQHGRLSMWRAFGQATPRVALIFRVPLREDTAGSLSILFSPVAYFTDQEVDAELLKVAANIQANLDFLCSLDRTRVVSTFFYMLMLSVTCLKHEGFREELEWRVIHSPKRMPSALVKSSSRVIDGVPQTVYEIPLQGGPPDDLADLSFSRMIDRVIIGPSQYPWVMYDVFVTALTAAGVTDASSRVFISGIPIRT